MKLLLALMVLLIIPLVASAEYTLQETADSSTDAAGVLESYYQYEDEYVRGSSLWQVKHGYSASLYNITIDDDCYYNSTHLRLRIYRKGGTAPGWSSPYCHDGSGWVAIGTNSSSSGAGDAGAGTASDSYDGSYSTYVSYHTALYLLCDPTPADPACNAQRVYEEGLWWYTGELYDVVFYVRNPYQQYLSGANVTLTRLSDGFVIGSDLTDFSGAVLFELGEGLEYNISVTVDGYEDFNDSLTAIESTYAITMGFLEGEISQYQGIEYGWFPRASPLYMNETYNFSYHYNSSYWSVEGCWFSLLDQNDTVIATNTTNCSSSAGRSSHYEILTVWNNTFTGRFTMQLNGTNITYYHEWGIINFTQGDISIANALDTFADFDGAGFDDFGRWIIAVIFIVFITWGATTKAELQGEPERVLLLVWALVGIASFANLLPLSFLEDAYMAQYGVFTLVSILTAAAGIISWRLNA